MKTKLRSHFSPSTRVCSLHSIIMLANISWQLSEEIYSFSRRANNLKSQLLNLRE